MAMVFCRGCARQLHESAPTCPQCGAPQFAVPANTQASGGQTPWLGAISLILGVNGLSTLFDDGEWDNDTLLGLSLFAGMGLIMGIISISQKRPGNGLAIAGLILSGISLFFYIGLSRS
ncbi:RING-HC finger protein [Pseudomonas faucium]|uniref:RING-HC finger protein n=1 Tax=Pseudomonas faucium TaxID=2740518 RepID=UPI001596CD66|nr:RING-HC finger protein [Pseudomonas faucium]